MHDRKANGQKILTPKWEHCLNYEFELLSIQESSWAAYEDPEHRLQNWILFITIANARPESSGDVIKYQKMERRLAELEKRGSRPSPYGKEKGKQPALPAGTPLALQAGPAQKGRNKADKGKGKNKNGEKGKSGPRPQGPPPTPAPLGPAPLPASGAFRDFATILQTRRVRDRFVLACFGLQEGRCSNTQCRFPRVCVGCGSTNRQYNQCGCLEASVSSLGLDSTETTASPHSSFSACGFSSRRSIPIRTRCSSCVNLGKNTATPAHTSNTFRSSWRLASLSGRACCGQQCSGSVNMVCVSGSAVQSTKRFSSPVLPRSSRRTWPNRSGVAMGPAGSQNARKPK